MARAAASNDATTSALNYTETLQKAARAGVAVDDVDVALEALEITVSPPPMRPALGRKAG